MSRSIEIHIDRNERKQRRNDDGATVLDPLQVGAARTIERATGPVVGYVATRTATATPMPTQTPSPTQAPMLTKLGISTTSRPK